MPISENSDIKCINLKNGAIDTSCLRVNLFRRIIMMRAQKFLKYWLNNRLNFVIEFWHRNTDYSHRQACGFFAKILKFCYIIALEKNTMQEKSCPKDSFLQIIQIPVLPVSEFQTHLIHISKTLHQCLPEIFLV